MIQRAIDKAGVLLEAMPYIQAFRGETVVVKFGGSILNDRKEYEPILRDIAMMEIIGMRPVVIHGGGKAITRAMADAGIEARFLHGLRVTDAETITLVERVLNGEVNPRLCEILNRHHGHARGIRGQDILTARKHTGHDPDTGEALDWGFVGEVTRADIAAIRHVQDQNMVPVITPIGKDAEGALYNINADEAAAAIARELKARKLVFLSDVPGLMRDPTNPDTVMSTLSLGEVEALIADGTISGGMLPKIGGAVKALRAGVRKTHIIDSALEHSLLLELFTDEGVGTEIVHGPEEGAHAHV